MQYFLAHATTSHSDRSTRVADYSKKTSTITSFSGSSLASRISTLSAMPPLIGAQQKLINIHVTFNLSLSAMFAHGSEVWLPIQHRHSNRWRDKQNGRVQNLDYQGVVTPVRTILRAATGVIIRSPSDRGFCFMVTGSRRFFQSVTDKILR